GSPPPLPSHYTIKSDLAGYPNLTHFCPEPSQMALRNSEVPQNVLGQFFCTAFILVFDLFFLMPKL
ncbi:hypothetical protein VC95412_000179B, partial [Vibrio cholerae O1 str. 95412]